MRGAASRGVYKNWSSMRDKKWSRFHVVRTTNGSGCEREWMSVAWLWDDMSKKILLQSLAFHRPDSLVAATRISKNTWLTFPRFFSFPRLPRNGNTALKNSRNDRGKYLFLGKPSFHFHFAGKLDVCFPLVCNVTDNYPKTRIITQGLKFSSSTKESAGWMEIGSRLRYSTPTTITVMSFTD